MIETKTPQDANEATIGAVASTAGLGDSLVLLNRAITALGLAEPTRIVRSADELCFIAEWQFPDAHIEMESDGNRIEVMYVSGDKCEHWVLTPNEKVSSAHDKT